jgi:hypothetical protein
MRTPSDRSPTSDIHLFGSLLEKRDENSQIQNSRSESGSSRSRGHVEVDLSLRKDDTLKDGKNYALKLPKPEIPK